MSADLPDVQPGDGAVSPRQLIARKLPTNHNHAWAQEIIDDLAAHGWRIVQTVQHPAAPGDDRAVIVMQEARASSPLEGEGQ